MSESFYMDPTAKPQPLSDQREPLTVDSIIRALQELADASDGALVLANKLYVVASDRTVKMMKRKAKRRRWRDSK